MPDEMSWGRKEELRHQYNRELFVYAAEARAKVDAMERYGLELCGYLRRIDEAVDDIAKKLGLEVPYIGEGKWLQENDARYNTAFRVEMLRNQIAELDTERG